MARAKITPEENPLPPPPRKRSPRKAAEPASEGGAKPKYTVIRDTREKEGQGWEFPKSASCAGTVRSTLKTGDYTLRGLEEALTIDRKGAVSEFCTNVFDARFARELERMSSFKLAIVLLEFEMEDILRWPETSSIPKYRWKKLRVNKHGFLKRFWELQLKFPHVHFIFAGHYGMEAASSLFKRAFATYGQPEP